MIVDIVSPFLFFIPHAQLERAETIAVDRYIMSHQWESFLDEIQEEWNQTSLLVNFPFTSLNLDYLNHSFFRQQLLWPPTAHFWRFPCSRIQLSSRIVPPSKLLAIRQLRPAFSDSSLLSFFIDTIKPEGLAYLLNL
jgi:hypothetical protein